MTEINVREILDDNSFTLCTDNLPTERTVQCIDGLQNRTFQDPDRFCVRGRLNNQIANALHRTFEDFAARGIQWRRLDLYVRRDSEIEPQRLGDALGIANRGSLFQVIDIQTLGLDGENGHQTDSANLPTDLQVLSSLDTNQRLIGLHLSRFVLSPEDLSSLSSALRTSKTFRTFTFTCATTAENSQGLGEALAANKSLEVAFLYERNEVTSQLMRAVVGHPTLEDLRVISKINSDLPVVLSEILSSPACHLKTLAVFMDNSNDPTNIAPLLQGIKRNKSLTFLASWFHFPGEHPLTNFLQIWKSHPKLQRVEFWERFSIEDIEEAKGGMRFSRRVNINYVEPEGAKRPRDDRYEASVKELLDVHPEICWSNDDLHSEGTQYASFLNHSGRYLLNREVPQALWSFVLERVQKASLAFPANLKASAVYELLHGQAFAGRASAKVSGKKRRWDEI